MTSIQPELWVERPRDAVAFYQAAFGAVVLHLVGDGDEIVAQLAVGGAAFWVAGAAADMGRLSPLGAHGATGRTLLVTDDPDEVVRRAVAAGATVTSAVAAEHGWRLGRIVDPFGHEWEVGVPLGPWPPP
ncbi:MAG TPA: VOC family protein [Miltoncostaeaceae bacterium]|nr:VOC family protein [Miltoncostaeaceae bacterium]